MHIHIYIYIYTYIRPCCTQSFLGGTPAHISNVYFSKSKGLKGPHHSWKLFHKNFYNLEYLVSLKMHFPARFNVFLQTLC